MSELLALFVVCNIANVMLQTLKSIATIKGTPLAAAAMNAVSYAFYTYIIIITSCELPIWEKMLIVGLCNLIGVYVVKIIERKHAKDKLWKVEVTVGREDFESIFTISRQLELSFNYIDIGKWYVMNFYCKTQADSKNVKDLLKNFNVKYFVSESKIL